MGIEVQRAPGRWIRVGVVARPRRVHFPGIARIRQPHASAAAGALSGLSPGEGATRNLARALCNPPRAEHQHLHPHPAHRRLSFFK
jgi:hypothetical protein